MKKFNKNMLAKIFRCLYLISLLIMVLLILTIITTRKSKNTITHSTSYTTINDVWTLTPDGDDYVDVNNLGQYFKDGYDTLSIYWRLPNTKYDQSLIFRSKDVYCYAFIDDELLFLTDNYESPFYNASPGNNWNFFTIPSSYSNDILELRIKYVYGTGSVLVDHFFYGEKFDWVLDFLISKGVAIFLSAFIIFIGLVIMSMDYGSHKRSGKHSLLYLGIYAVLMGLWSLIETNTLQLFFNDGRIIQLADNLLMVTDTLPLFFYLDSEFDIFKSRILRLITLADIFYIFVCLIGQFTGLTDLHNLLAGSWIATGLSFFVLVGILAKQIIAFIRGEKIKKRIMLQIIGFMSLMIIVIICLPIFVRSDGLDRAESIRLGMLAMIIMFAIAGQLQTYELIMAGTRYDIVKNLAYQDALTGLLNRTSFLEAIEKYQSNPPSKIGVIFFDVNNLKTANDFYGHEIGDQLICSSAELIEQSFSKLGSAYRTGGDEFLVFLDGENPQKDYEEGLEIFNKELALLNKSGKFIFQVSIAHGFALCEKPDAESIKVMIKNADEIMYENKKQLKMKA